MGIQGHHIPSKVKDKVTVYLYPVQEMVFLL